MTSLATLRVLATAIAMLGLANAFAELPLERAALAAIETGQELNITVPTSSLEVRLQRSGFVPVFSSPNAQGTIHPRYFFLGNKHREIYISCWFEPSSKFKGLRETWDEERAASPRSGPTPENIAFGSLEAWRTVAYTLPASKDGAAIAHLRAHWVEAETWIDLHLSAQGDSPLQERFSSLADFLRSIRVIRKSGTSETVHIRRSLARDSGQVALDLPATERIYVYDVSVAGNPGHGVEGALLIARFGTGTVSLQSLPLVPHKTCDSRVFGLILNLVRDKRIAPEAVKFSKHPSHSLHVFPRLDDQVRQWIAVFSIDNECVELVVTMPSHLPDSAPLVADVIRSVRLTR